MAWIITKYLLTAGMVVFISEVTKRSDRLGGFIAALPLMTLLTLAWLYIENQPEDKIAKPASKIGILDDYGRLHSGNHDLLWTVYFADEGLWN
jgi:hypothetical protein